MTKSVLVATLTLLVVSVAALCLGTPLVGVNRLPAAFAGATDLEHAVVVLLRAPRLVLGLLVGAALAVAGLLLQESLRNPLAVPELLGVSSGAAVLVGVCVVWALPFPGAPLVPALIGAVVGGLITLLAARRAVGPAAVLLIGVAVNAAMQALLLTAVSLSDSREQGVLFRYLLGSLTGTTWESVAVSAPGLIALLPLALLCVPLLGVLRLGDETASALGVRADRARLIVLVVACALVAIAVAPSGPIAWVGFLGPHLARRLRPNADPRIWLAWSALFGALLVVVADLAARTVLAPVELPVGGLTALVAIVLAALVIRRRGELG
ncbi:iron ABC transporter permease [Allokutzneria sp. A3M-2-11 16]|uniref:FecCD family ABC transporter permease n=1 Tax=Allokutzneria sp. A3M-2-11 16 TaxID=2962043 RepID=UPI0020B67A15|nr:iron ABC transporter permease [Allokutzneria sp. A3M-2-11 16]MCP3799700.1 iron ABC transporter permease [Allokutzneria sp. A3M-2-11 16]